MTPRFMQSTRRAFLGSAALGVVASALPARAEQEPVALEDYKPEFFAPAEWVFVMAAVARIIPSEGEGPGALEARVPVFIDRQLAGEFGAAADLYMEGPFEPGADENLGPQSPLTPAEIYREGIAAFDSWCLDQKGAEFAGLEAGAQDEALTSLADGDAGLDAEVREFWPLLLQNVKEGYFSDPKYGGNHGMASWVHIGFPGARANFLEWVGRDEPYPLGPVDIAGNRA